MEFLTRGVEKGCHLWHKSFCNKELKPTEEAALMPTECTQKQFGFHPIFSGKWKPTSKAGGSARTVVSCFCGRWNGGPG